MKHLAPWWAQSNDSKRKKTITVINTRILWTLQSKLLSAQQLPLAYEEPFTIYKALSLLSPGVQSGERAAWGQFSPLQGGNLEAQRGWAGWPRLPSSERLGGLAEVARPVTEGTSTQTGPALILPPVLSSYSVPRASASRVSPALSALRALILLNFSPFNGQSNVDTTCIRLCDHRKEALLL